MTQKEFEKMFLDLNSVLVKFWIKQGRPAKEIKIELLERMLNWYKKMGYVTLDKQEDKLPAGLEEAADISIRGVVPIVVNGEYYYIRKQLFDVFIAGAKWDRAKMMEEAVKVKAFTDYPLLNFSSPKEKREKSLFKAGQEVKLIIIPEDENVD